jgi:transcriptional regulator with XRE-family HTH domain
MDFVAWLKNELVAQNWSQADLSRATGLSSGTIANVLNEKRKPGVDFVLAVARALRVEPEDLYRRAGFLPRKPTLNHGPIINEAIDVLQRLSPEEQEEILNYAKYRYQQSLNS